MGVLKGFLERRMLRKFISRTLMEMRNRITDIEKTGIRKKNRV